MTADPHKLSSIVTTVNGTTFRDLNHNGKLDIYEDPTQPIEARVEDLLSQMTLEEKAGQMFINGAHINATASLEKLPEDPFHPFNGKQQVDEQKMSHFNLWDIPNALTVAKWYNRIQQYAETTRLGIPVTVASDPRNHFTRNIFSMAATDFTQWCETLGFAAINDPALVRQFAEIARREYLAVGIRVSLHPQIDLATEPRWPRISGTFGEDADITSRLVVEYIKGFQGERLNDQSVACMTKHFPGGGPQKDGLDPHFEFQKGQVYPGNNFEYHLRPFEAALKAGTASMMPYYGVPTDQTDENVAMSFNKTIITSLLRQKYNFDGVVCTDWGLISDAHIGDVVWPARAWGVENLTEEQRVLKAILAGVDQFGGESCPQHVISLVQKGLLTEERIDRSLRRLLRQKFQLGLFDAPFVDEAAVPAIMADAANAKLAAASQMRAHTLLKNNANILPLKKAGKIYIKNIDPAIAGEYATVVPTTAEADLAILRLDTPWVPVDTKNPFALGFHHGDLDFKGEALQEILDTCAALPTIVVIYLDRPAVIPQVSQAAAAVVAEYGASDRNVLEVVFGNANPEGNLPFELPSSMQAVYDQKEDLPHDSKDPLYPFGFGLRYQ